MIVLLCIAMVALVAMALLTIEADMADDRGDPSSGLLYGLSLAVGVVFLFAVAGVVIVGVGLP